MATDEFLSCLSRKALEREAQANAVRVETRVKDTRARMIAHFAGATWHYPDALFKLSESEAQDLPSHADAEHPGPDDEPDAGEGTEATDQTENVAHDNLADAAD